MIVKCMCNYVGGKRAPFFALAIPLVGGCLISQTVSGLPIDGVVVQGDAVIDSSSDTTLTITQESDRAVINFEEFSIDEHEQVIFIQPGKDASVLNRVVGNNLSEIYGDISANGKVFLVNTNGVIFGEGANVNVGGLVASTFNISDDEYIQGQLVFRADAQSGSITNNGTLRSHGESGLAFVAPVVVNNGVIEAVGADIQIVSQTSSNPSLRNAVFIQQEGSPISHMIETGVSEGRVENTGVIRATRVENSSGELGGDVVLVGGQQSEMYNTGVLESVSAANIKESGNIVIEGGRIAQLGEVSTNAVGGGDAGNIKIYAHSVAAIGEESITTANADADGNGGEVIFYSPDTALFRSGALIEARGGTDSGNGGFVEVSGLTHVEAHGLVRTLAENGTAGTYLIDPYDIVISLGPDTQGGWASPFTPTSSGSIINVNTLQTNLQSGSVSIDTANGAGADFGDININDRLNLDGTNGNTLTLRADRDIIFAPGASFTDQNTVTADDVNISLSAGGRVFMDDTSLIDVNAGIINITAGGNFRVGGLRSTSSANNAIVLNIGNDVADAGSTHLDLDLPNGRLDITARGSVPLEIDVNEIDYTFTGVDVDITNANSLTVISGSSVGGVNIATTTGDLNVAGNINLDGSDGSTLTFSTGGSFNLATGVSIADQVNATEDNTNIAILAGGNISLADTSAINSGAGTISLTSGGNTQITSLTTTFASPSIDAVTINSGGTITDAGDSATDISAVNGSVALTAASGIGNVSFLETNIQELNATITGAGNLRIVEENDIIVGSINNVENFDLLANSGTVTIADTGLNVVGSLFIRSLDLTGETGRSVILSAQDAFLDVNSFASNTIINSNFDTLDGSFGGVGTEVINSDALQLTDSVSDADDNVLNFSASTVTVRTLVGDLSVSSDIDLDGANGGVLTLGSGVGADLVFTENIEIQDQNTATTDDVNLQFIVGDELRMSATTLFDASGGTIDVDATGQLFIGGMRSTNTGDAIRLTVGSINDQADSSFYMDVDAQSGQLVIDATGDVSLANDLDINVDRLQVTNGGSVNILEVDGLEISSIGTVTDLNVAVSAGALRIPDAGVAVAGQLSLAAQDVLDVSGRNLDLAANSLVLNVLGLAEATTIASNVNSASITVGNSLSMTNANGVSLDGLNTASDFSLSTVSGNIVIPNDIDTDAANGSHWSFNSAGDTTINAGVSIQDSNLVTQDNIDFEFSSAGQFDARDISALNSGDGTIQISAGGNIRITNAVSSGSTIDAIQLSGANVLGDGSQRLDISAVNGGVVFSTSGRVTGEVGSYLEVNAQRIDATMTGTGDFIVDVDNDFSFIGSGLHYVDIRSTGTLTLEDAGLQSSGDIFISAPEIRDSDNAISLTASQSYLDITAPTQDVILNSELDALDVNLGGAANLTVNESSDVDFVDLSGDDQAIAINNGNFTVLSFGDLHVSNNINAQDQIADGVRSGMISVESTTGNIVVASVSDVSITSLNTVDQIVDGGVGNGINGNASQTSIYFGLQNNIAETRSINLGGDTTAADLAALGGDIEIDGRGNGSSTLVAASVNISTSSSITAYNEIADALDGELYLDGVSVAFEPNITVRSGRQITLLGVNYIPPSPIATPTPVVTSVPTPIVVRVSNENIIAAANTGQDSVNNSAATQPEAEEPQYADDAFDFVFGASQCDDLSEENKGQCNVEESIKAFLSHWTVGGQLPSQTLGVQ